MTRKKRKSKSKSKSKSTVTGPLAPLAQAITLASDAVDDLRERYDVVVAELQNERAHRERLEWERTERERRSVPRRVIFMSDAGPAQVTAEQLAAIQKAAEGGILGRKLRGFSSVADDSGNVLIDLSGHYLMGDPVWGRKLAFTLLYTSEIAHMVRKQMGSKMGFQHCESLFHCNCYFGLRTPQHRVEVIGKCCFCDRLASDDDRDPIAVLDDGRPA